MRRRNRAFGKKDAVGMRQSLCAQGTRHEPPAAWQEFRWDDGRNRRRSLLQRHRKDARIGAPLHRTAVTLRASPRVWRRVRSRKQLLRANWVRLSLTIMWTSSK